MRTAAETKLRSVHVHCTDWKNMLQTISRLTKLTVMMPCCCCCCCYWRWWQWCTNYNNNDEDEFTDTGELSIVDVNYDLRLWHGSQVTALHNEWHTTATTTTRHNSLQHHQQHRTVGFGPRSFSAAGPSACNSLPSELNNTSLIIIIIIIIIKEIYIAPFRHAPKALCKKKVKC